MGTVFLRADGAAAAPTEPPPPTPRCGTGVKGEEEGNSFSPFPLLTGKEREKDCMFCTVPPPQASIWHWPDQSPPCTAESGSRGEGLLLPFHHLPPSTAEREELIGKTFSSIEKG